MGWSIKIARIAGTEVKIHFTFVLLLIWIGLGYYASGGAQAAVEGIAFIVALFGCVLLHEFGHALMARRFGISTPDITLLPIGGVARLQRMPDRPGQEILVALAGPAVNVVIAGVLYLVLGRMGDPSDVERLASPQTELLHKLAAVNVSLVLFNLLPAFPMDGGRVLRAALAMFMSYSRATQIAARLGQGMALLFGLFGLFSGSPILMFVALFVYLAAAQESSYAQMKEIVQGLQVADAMMTRFAVLRPEDRLQTAVDALIGSGRHAFPVVDDGGRPVGILTGDDMVAAYRRQGAETLVADVMHRDVPTISEHAPLEPAMRQMQESDCPALAVVDPSGTVVGLVTLETIGQLIMLRSTAPAGISSSVRRGSGFFTERAGTNWGRQQEPHG
jgi:Zn-dependent protease/CBS domain-containing protein